MNFYKGGFPLITYASNHELTKYNTRQFAELNLSYNKKKDNYLLNNNNQNNIIQSNQQIVSINKNKKSKIKKKK